METIAEAHEMGIAHRDLKPSNIMLEPARDGLAARVLDFGIAKVMERGTDEAETADTATHPRARAFTAASAAPEQLAGCRTGPWTDVYALALLLTEVLTDRPPIVTDEPHERHRIAFADARPTPASLGVDIGAWEAILARALAVKPRDRQRDARTLLDELDGAMRSEEDPRHLPPHARETGAVVRERERELAERAERLLLGLGEGFALVGRDLHLEAGGEHLHVDLLLYHLKLRRFVVVDVEPPTSPPGLTDRLSARLSVVDAQLRHPADAPSIGLRLRNTKNGLTVAYALGDCSPVRGPRRQSTTRMVAVLQDELTGNLPAVEELRAGLAE